MRAVFLDVERAFDSVPHGVILSSLSHLGSIGNMFRFVASYFSVRTYGVRLGPITSSVRQLDPEVPHGSCLSPIHFNIVLTTLPRCLSSRAPSPFCGIIIYTGDICLWASHRTRRTQRPFVQASISSVCSMLTDIGFSVSASKTTVLTC